jgi:hypothetical protein
MWLSLWTSVILPEDLEDSGYQKRYILPGVKKNLQEELALQNKDH